MEKRVEDRFSRNTLTRKRSASFLRAVSSVGSPVADEILGYLRDDDYASVVSASIDPSSYTDGSLFRRDYLAVNLLRKYDGFPLGIDTASVALEGFLATERACAKTNRSKVRPYVIHSCGLTPESYISYAREKIRSLLGPFSWAHASDHFGFSGGASTRLRRRSGAPYHKYQGKPETTRSNALLSIAAIRDCPLWAAAMVDAYGYDTRNWVKIVEGSNITTVAKTAKTDRVIAIEPCMNMYVQRGIGALIRRKLKSVRIDLDDQTHNQKLAWVGSRTGSLVTIDLASASDSIALSLVELLLPRDWYEAMCLCRSEYGILPNGQKHLFEKISSMGNGYTFELESLIFWALSRAVIDLNDVSDRRLGIYGDDIVIHNSCAEELIEVLAYTGFTTNKEKTFLSGPFRESCGKHYFYGRDVTPIYIKTPVETLNRAFWIANSFRSWQSGEAEEPVYQTTYDYLVSTIPKKHRYLIPVSLGSEAGLWASFEEAVPRYATWRQSFSLKLLQSTRKYHTPNGAAAVLHYFNGSPVSYRESNGSVEGSTTGVRLSVGEVMYRHSRRYVPWWDAAPCGVIIRPTMRNTS